jgi:hypothetical protein
LTHRLSGMSFLRRMLRILGLTTLLIQFTVLSDSPKARTH